MCTIRVYSPRYEPLMMCRIVLLHSIQMWLVDLHALKRRTLLIDRLLFECPQDVE
jgi:hypothetical protein